MAGGATPSTVPSSSEGMCPLRGIAPEHELPEWEG